MLWSLTRTQLGTALSAIEMNEDSVRCSGLNTTKLKLFAFMVSAMVAGIWGAFYAHYLGSIAPRALFDINFLFTIIVAALIGGASTIVGPIAGAFFLTFLLEYLRPYLPGTERYFIANLGLVHDLFPVLSERRSQESSTLSGGERQMVSLGRALMSSPKLLLVDEPTIGLAPKVCLDIAAALKRLNEERGLTIVITEQNVNFALSLAG